MQVTKIAAVARCSMELESIEQEDIILGNCSTAIPYKWIKTKEAAYKGINLRKQPLQQKK